MWTDPDEAARWWHPRGVTTPRDSVHIDARVGGTYGYTMVLDATGGQYRTGGVYLEVERPTRLVFTWAEPGVTQADPEESPVVTVTLEPVDGRTRMTFELRGIPGSPGDDGVHDGWTSAFDVLADHLQPPVRP